MSDSLNEYIEYGKYKYYFIEYLSELLDQKAEFKYSSKYTKKDAIWNNYWNKMKEDIPPFNVTNGKDTIKISTIPESDSSSKRSIECYKSICDKIEAWLGKSFLTIYENFKSDINKEKNEIKNIMNNKQKNSLLYCSGTANNSFSSNNSNIQAPQEIQNNSMALNQEEDHSEHSIEDFSDFNNPFFKNLLNATKSLDISIITNNTLSVASKLSSTASDENQCLQIEKYQLYFKNFQYLFKILDDVYKDWGEFNTLVPKKLEEIEKKINKRKRDALVNFNKRFDRLLGDSD
jgi:hypothetical protein